MGGVQVEDEQSSGVKEALAEFLDSDSVDRGLSVSGDFVVVHDHAGLDSEHGNDRRTYKDDSQLRDQQSTGRKRAARWFPLDEDEFCEWRMLKNCGGGDFPITGCLNGKQEARHHGPDKNTLNNEEGNVHRICHKCHNRWHTKNDPEYTTISGMKLHEPIPASAIDVGISEAEWKNKKLVTAKD